ncbi:MAG: sodium/proline symporter, partial [Lachnospiraceae bacterium]|nr:sodium/proline symporter [Lachnospiraceae bacterium]
MSSSQMLIIVSILAYMAVVVGIGIYFSKKNKNSDDFYLGGRTLGPIVTAMSAEASDMSSWLLMGLPGLTLIAGIADPGWTAIGLALGTYVNWLIVAKRLRQYSQAAGNAITIPEFFKNRYNDSTNVLLAMSALVILVFFIPYTASGFSACGKLFSSLFGIDYFPAMVISGLIISGYTMLGGFLAASTTDLIQSIVMTIALIVVVFYGIDAAGGMDVVINNAKAVEGYLSMTTSANTATGESGPYGFLTIVSTMAWGLGYFGMPHILLRFMAIRDENEVTLARRIASIWVVISMGVAILIGVIGYSLSLSGVVSHYETTSESERILIEIAGILSEHGVLLALIGGLILAGILACTMSTADSQLLAASSSVSQNLLIDVVGMKLTDAQRVLAARLTVVGIAIVAMVIARDPNSSVFTIVSFAWAGFGASFGPIMLFSLFWRRTTRLAAIAGMLTGGVSVFVWKYLVRPMGGAFDLYELLPAFLLSAVVIVAVSLATEEPEQSILDTF